MVGRAPRVSLLRGEEESSAGVTLDELSVDVWGLVYSVRSVFRLSVMALACSS